MSAPIFRDRGDAGRQLAQSLLHLRDDGPVVMGMPRGGVFVAAEIVRECQGRLDLMIVRRITAPGRNDATVGAIADAGEVGIFCDDLAMANYGMSRHEFDEEVARLRYEIALQQNRYAAGRPRSSLQNKVVILADDTIVTGSTAKVALRAAYRERARYVVIAAPVAVLSTAEALRGDCDEFVVLAQVADLDGARRAYADFQPMTDSDVVRIIRAVPATYA